MTSRIAKFLVAALFFGLARAAFAGVPAIDIFDVVGVAGTGGDATVAGPCYCEQQAYFSPVMLLQPGTYDFGKLRDYWVQSGYTPDGGPDQQNFYLLFDPVATSGSFPEDFAPPPTYAFPSSYGFCDQLDDACNAAYRGAYKDFDLVFTVSPGDNALQVGLIGIYQYTAPVPEPVASVMFIVGLVGMARLSTRRRRAG
jgi:hypothetical protein